MLGRLITTGYLVLSVLILAGLVIGIIGFPGQETRKLVRHIEFRGVAVTVPSISGNTSNVRITGDVIDSQAPIKRSFRWFALSPSSWIDLRPDKTEGALIKSYRAEAHTNGAIVRLNRICVNKPVGSWTVPELTTTYHISTPERKSAGSRRKSSKSTAIEVKLSRNTLSFASQDWSSVLPIPPILDHISLRELVKQAKADALRKQLQPLNNGYGTSALDSIQFIRQRRGDGDSPVGLLYLGLQEPPKLLDPSDDTYDQLAQIRCDSSDTIPQTGIEAINDRFRLEVFSTDSRNALLLPTQQAPTAGGHAQLRFLFDPPRSYPLPPADVLKAHGNQVQLASTDMGQDGDGYLFETGNLNEGFLATAHISDDGTQMGIVGSSSDASSKIVPNENQILGGGTVAPIYCLADPFFKAGYPWFLPAVGLIAGLLLCVSSYARLPILGSKRRRQIPVNIAPVHGAFVLWVVSSALLAVRLVLAYRISVLPPFNMDAVSAASFRGAWIKAWLPALILPPTLGFLSIAVVHAKQPAARQGWTEKFGDLTARNLQKVAVRPWLFLSRASYGLALFISVVLFLQKAVHFPFPDLVLLAVLLVVLGIVFEGVGEARDDDFEETASNSSTTAQLKLGEMTAKVGWMKHLLSKKQFWDRNPMLWASSLLLFALDPGTFLFFLPIVVALCVGGITAAFGVSKSSDDSYLISRAIRAKLALFSLLAVALFGVIFASSIGEKMLTSPASKAGLKGAAFPYRLAATNPTVAEHLLIDPQTRLGPFSPHKMQETLHQRWEMIAYQKANGVGYFAAPLSNVGMTYPTTLSDAAFSVYLVGEHGKLAGAMVIGLILLLALAVFRAAWLAACSKNQKANARGLFAIGGVFGCTAVYMALANMWVIPFTGQNVPLLSLNSLKDLILNGTLLVAAVLLIAFPGSWNSQADPLSRKDARNNAISWWLFPAVLTLGWLFVLVDLAATTGNPKQPYNLSSNTLTALQQAADEAREQVREGQIPLESTAAISHASTLVREMVASFDSGEVTKTALVQPRGALSSLTIDKHFFLLKSPFEHEEGVAWHGSLLASGKIKRHQLVVGGSRVPILMAEGMGPSEIILGQPIRTVEAQAIDIKQLVQSGRQRKTIDYGGIKLDGDRIILRWKSFGKPGTILINGQRPDLKLNELEIKESDIVSLEYTGSDGIPMKLSIHYLGATENKLAGVAWRNGKYARTYPQGSDFPLAYTIGEIGDEVARNAKKKPGDIQLSVDLQLQRDLQSTLRKWAKERGRLVDRGATMPDGLPFTAVSVLDSHSGQIRALASLPQCDPRDDFNLIEDRFGTESDAQVAARSSWALVNRTIGSTVKPISFAALNTQLDSKAFDLTQLHVSESSAIESYVDKFGENRRAYRKLGDIHLKQGKGLGSKENPRSDVDMFTYLRDSRTWPAVVTSTIGLVSDKAHSAQMKDELSKMMARSSGSDIRMGGQAMSFTPGQALHRLFTNPTTVSSIELADTAYFRGIEQCYGPNVVPFNTNEINRWDDGMERQFLAPFDLSASNKQSLKNLGLPEVHWADTTSLTDLDGQLIRYMIGGGECRWNAVTMATNFARITTGQKVQPTMSTVPNKVKETMPSPIDKFDWRKAHLINPLMQITTIPAEDLAKIRSTVSGGGYRIAMKTGTIDDGMGQNAMESEMLMFTIGRFSESTGFEPGHCVSGFLSIRSSKEAEGDVMVKGDLIKRVMPVLVSYLKRLESSKSK